MYSFLTRSVLFIVVLCLLTSCGGGGGGDNAPNPKSEDLTPDSFLFIDSVENELDQTVFSETASIQGISQAVPVEIEGGEFSIDGGAFSSEAATIVAGSTLSLKLNSSDSYSDEKKAVVTIGGYSTSFNVYTRSADVDADAIVFSDVLGVDPSSWVESSVQNVSGIEVSLPIAVIGGEYAVDGGPFTAATGMINNGQSLQLRALSNSQFSSLSTTTLDVGQQTVVFNFTTREVV